MKNKNGKLVLETLIFMILNIVFIVVMLIFVNSSGNREFVYEQTLSKEIALIIDNAKSDMIFSLDLTKYIDIAKKNNQPIDKIVRTDDNRVMVSLKQKGGYSYQYFSDYDVSIKIEKNILIIDMKENE